MPSRSWNQLKKEVLELLTQGDLTSSDIAGALAIDVHNAGMCLLKLFKQGLAYRIKGASFGKWRKPPFVYKITNRGIQRLRYYRELEQK